MRIIGVAEISHLTKYRGAIANFCQEIDLNISAG